ncbi:MAG: hypothetical protein ICV79_17245 [Flavisolibacter sp.]|nr:hypothetical protein [Flavisolibacter sp.]
MDNIENKMEDRYERRRERQEQRIERREDRHHYGSGRIWTGLFILIIGVAALLKSFLFPVPDWMFTWQMLLIILGFFIGVRHNFRGAAWFVLILLGGIFLLNDYYPGMIDQRVIWPLALIVLGLFMILKPSRRNWHWQEKQDENKPTNTPAPYNTQVYEDDDFLDSTSVFGGVKKTIISKNFKGGDVTNILGGTEINLTQSDIQGRAVLDVTQIFGGTKIIVPQHWDIKPEMAAIFGGIDDKRNVRSAEIDANKVLIVKGTSIFGGIEIKSY